MGEKPHYKGSIGVAAWVNEKDGEKQIAIDIGGVKVYLKQNKPKEMKLISKLINI